jgi:predicted RNA-binding protein YlqC (UPF0109 family)
MKEFIEYIARQLVDEPNSVSLTEEVDGDTIVYRLTVAQPDIGKVIGKKGRTAFALRTIVAAVGRKAGKKVLLEVID